MKILIINDDGVQAEIKPEQLVVSGLTFDKLLINFQEATRELKEFKLQAEKRERELLSLWNKIK